MLDRDEDILKAAEDWQKAGRGVALATVVETWGSAPRPAGSSLVINDEGTFLGSVSGGCVEGAVVTEAMDVIQSGKPQHAGVRRRRRDRLECRPVLRRHHPRLRREGRLAVKLAILHELNAERAARRPAILVTDTESGEQRLVKARDFAKDPLGAELEKQLRMGKSANVEAGGKKLFLNVYAPTAKLVIIGAVHISQALAPLARSLGYDVTVVDPRTAFASPERFPDIPLVAEWPDTALPPLNVDAYTAFVAVTHDPKIDDPALLHAFERNCFYIGALGSRKTHAKRGDRLRAQGARDTDIARIHAPIGLAIGAVSPSEIAVSIMAEITAVLRLPPKEKEEAA